MKEKLLEGLIEHMDGKMGDDLASKYGKGLEVSVAAPDSEHLADGLDKAKKLASSGMIPDDPHPMDGHMDDDSILGMMHDEDEDE